MCACSLCSQQRPLLSGRITPDTSRRQRSFPIGRFRQCDQNRIMAAATAVRSSVGLTLRLSRVIPDCTTCPLYRLKSCVNSVANLNRSGSFDSFRTINRHLQTSIGEWCSLLTRLALIRRWSNTRLLFVYDKSE